MKLQLALDQTDLNACCALLDRVADLVDIAEIGTPLIMQEGVAAVARVKRDFPHLEVLADLKIMDAGAHEAAIGFDAGADLVTVLGVSHNSTIGGVIDQARTSQRQVIVDLIAAPNAAQRAAQLDAMGAHYICVHTAYDIQSQGHDPLEELQQVQPILRRAAMAVAGGVKPQTMPGLLPYNPQIVVVGGFITGHDDPRQAAQAIKDHFPQEQ